MQHRPCTGRPLLPPVGRGRGACAGQRSRTGTACCARGNRLRAAVQVTPFGMHTIVVGTPIVALAHRQLLPPLAGALDLAVPPSAMP